MLVVPLPNANDLRLTAAEWKRIAKVLPPAPQDARRVSDRAVISVLLGCEATGMSVESISRMLDIAPQTARTRKARWAADGTLPRILDAAEPALARLRNVYCARYGQAAIDGAEALEILSQYWPGGRYYNR
jgi:transposase